MKEIEQEIPVLEEEIAAMTREMSLPGVAGDHELFSQIRSRYESTELRMQQLYAEWGDVSRQLEE
jgi:hypothetical protein